MYSNIVHLVYIGITVDSRLHTAKDETRNKDNDLHLFAQHTFIGIVLWSEWPKLWNS